MPLVLNGFSLGVAGREASYDDDAEEVEDDEEVVLTYSYMWNLNEFFILR